MSRPLPPSHGLVRRAAAVGGRIGAKLLVIVLLVSAVSAVVAAVLGVRMVPVLTGSMTPYAPRGALAVTVPVDGSAVGVGDVVAFRPPVQYQVIADRPVLHRVTDIDINGGQVSMSTQGDANPGPDPWQVDLAAADLARAVFVVPHVGRLSAGGRWTVELLVAGAVALYAARTMLAHRQDDPCTCQATGAATITNAKDHTATPNPTVSR